MGMRDFLPSERALPHRVARALGELERAREQLVRLEERGKIFPRLWISVSSRVRARWCSPQRATSRGAFAALDELDVDAAAKLPFDLAGTARAGPHAAPRQAEARSGGHAARGARDLRAARRARLRGAGRAELDRVGLRHSPDELTATERRVAELVAEGLTNREVASKAYMSPKTVQANLTRIYRKLGISSRAELGARMADERRRAAPQK